MTSQIEVDQVIRAAALNEAIDAAPQVEEAVLRQVLNAAAAMRRSDDADYVLEILVSTVRLVAPAAEVWAGRRASGARASEVASSRATHLRAGRATPVTVDLDAVLELYAPALAEGRPPFGVEVDGSPFAQALAQPHDPVEVTVFPMSSSFGSGALVVGMPFDDLAPAHLSALTLLADQASTALDLGSARAGARLTEALYDTLAQLSATYTDPEEVLQTVVRSTARLLRTDAAYVMLVDEDQEWLRVRTAFGITNQSFYEAAVRVDELLPGAAIRKRRVVCVRDVQEYESAKYSKPEGLRSVMCAPMFVEDELLGVLLAAHREIRDPSNEDRRTMGALASAAAVSIGNTRLFAERESSIRQLGEVNHLLEKRSNALERTMLFQKQLTALVLAGSGLDEIVRTMTETLDRLVLVLDRDFTVLHSAGAPGDEVDLDLNALRCAIASSEETATGLGVSRLVLNTDERDVHVLVAPLDLAGGRTAFVVVVEGEQSLEATDLGLTESGVTAIGLELMRDRALAEAEARLTGGLFQTLLSSEDVNEGMIARRASYLGFELSGSNVVIGIVATPDPVTPGRRAPLSLETCVQRAVRGRRESPTAVFERDDAVYVLLTDPSEVTAAMIKEYCSAIKEELGASGWATGVRIAHAGPHLGIAGVREGVTEASYALHVLEVLGKTGSAVAFGDLGVWTLLGRVGNRDHLLGFAESVLGPLIDRDSDRQSRLVETLRTLVQCNFHYRSAAEALYAHPNTLRYRMSRITELTGLDLSDGDNRLKVEIALRILDVMGPSDNTKPVRAA